MGGGFPAPLPSLDVREQQVDQEIDEVEFGASNSSFDSGEELEDESDPDYDPYRDC